VTSRRGTTGIYLGRLQDDSDRRIRSDTVIWRRLVLGQAGWNSFHFLNEFIGGLLRLETCGPRNAATLINEAEQRHH